MDVDAHSPSPLAASNLVRRVSDFSQKVRGRLKPEFTSETARYGLRRDLEVPIAHPSAKIPISVRPVTTRDIAILLPEDTSAFDPADQKEVFWRRGFVDKVGIEGCHVAIDERDGSPAYMQWLFGPTRNDAIRKVGGFADLAPDEALLENAYTPHTHRGLGIMSAAMALIAERGAALGARYVLTYVGTDNIASLKGCHRAGFAPHLVHTRRFTAYGLLKSDSFATMPADDTRRILSF